MGGRSLFLLAALGTLVLATLLTPSGSRAATLELKPVARLERPTSLTSHKSSPGRILITEKVGRVRVLERGILLRQPLLDIRRQVASNALERGLLGIALPPDHRKSRLLYIAYTRLNGDLAVEEWRVRKRQPNLVDRSSRRLVITIPALPGYTDHNGGVLRFVGENLFITVGDGSSPGDIFDQAQDLRRLRGKILRINPRPDRSTGRPYRVPAGNPFTGGPGRQEIFAFGLRNPHALHFHRATGGELRATVYDVGQFRFEEVNHLSLESLRGANLGWKVWEGFERYDCGERCPNPATDELSGPLVWPVHVYGRDQGCAVIGGPVVRDTSLAGLRGRLVFGDFCAGNLRSAVPSSVSLDPVQPIQVGIPRDLRPLNAINEDGRGRIYVLSNQGRVFRLQVKR